MNRLIAVIAVALAVVGCASQKANQAAVSVTAEASAADCDTALRQAKTMAADNVAGTFIHGQRTLSQDRDYSESLNEYSGGVVQKYAVLEKQGNSPCTIKIQAWVAPGKNAIKLNPQSTQIGTADINQRAAQMVNDRSFLARHLRDVGGFTVTMGQMKVAESKPGLVRVDTLVTSIEPTQRWLDDFEGFIRVRSDLVVYELDTPAKSFARLLNPWQKDKKVRSSAPEVCFVHDNAERINCYIGDDVLLATSALTSLRLDIQMIQKGVVLQEETQFVSHLRLFGEQTLGQSYRAPGYAPRDKFPIIKAAPLPIDAHISFRGSALPKDVTIQGRVYFPRLERFPLD